MITRIARGRDGYVLHIDPELLAELGIDEGTPVSVRKEAGQIVVTPAYSEARQGVYRGRVEEVNQRFGLVRSQQRP